MSVIIIKTHLGGQMHLQLSEDGLEGMGSVQMQVLYVDHTAKSGVDCWSIAPKGMAQLLFLSTLLEEPGNYYALIFWMSDLSYHLEQHQF